MSEPDPKPIPFNGDAAKHEKELALLNGFLQAQLKQSENNLQIALRNADVREKEIASAEKQSILAQGHIKEDKAGQRSSNHFCLVAKVAGIGFVLIVVLVFIGFAILHDAKDLALSLVEKALVFFAVTGAGYGVARYRNSEKSESPS